MFAECLQLAVMLHVMLIQSEKDSKEEILKAFKLFDDDDTVRSDKPILFTKMMFYHPFSCKG